MKKFLVHLILFVICIVAIDQIGGRAMLKLYFNVKKNYPAKLQHAAHDGSEDVIVYGSSRAFRHYNPEYISKESGLSVYNAGTQGNGVLFAYGLYLVSREHHIPKIALVDVFYEYDQTKRFANTRFIDLLKPFYGESADLRKYFKRIDPWTVVTMNSMLYRTNSQLFSILKNQKQPEHFENGFDPLPPAPKAINAEITKIEDDGVYDSSKVQILEDMIELMKKDGVKVILVFSPIWYNVDGFEFRDSLANVASRHQVEFWDYTSNDSLTVEDFHDNGHLNGDGANKFSRLIGRRLRTDLISRTTNESVPIQ